MATVHDYTQRIQATLAGKTEVRAHTIAEARIAIRRVVQLQRELRQIKKEISLTMKSLRAHYADQKETVSKDSFGKGVMQGMFGKKSVSRMDAAQKDRIRRMQNTQLAPYEALQQKIDAFLLEYDGIKLQLEQWMMTQQ